MQNNKAIPNGFMTVGELAKKMNTTVRALQYYDKKKLLSPSAESEGGRRLYTDKDMVKLHQIQSMKYLGFSLDDIKSRLIFLESPSDVAAALAKQELAIKEKISVLTQALDAIHVLKEETMQMQEVDFKKYADIVYLLQTKNEFYWVIKHFDEKLLDHIQDHIDEKSGTELIETWKRLCSHTADCQRNNISPESEEGQALAKEWWDMILRFTGGDMSLLPELLKFSETRKDWAGDWSEKQELSDRFLSEALKVLFQNQGYDPFEEGQDERKN